MKVYTIERRQIIPASLDEAWRFFSSPRNLAVITPPYMNFEILSISGDEKMHSGQMIHYKVNAFPLVRVRWKTEITNVSEPHSFTDEQRKGPFTLWRHTHRFKPHKDGVEMTDVVEYALPFGMLGHLTHSLLVRRQLNAIFDFRYTVLENHFTKKSSVTLE
jgi:ligand-binding SRPBCC domain-containing protein